MEEVVVSDEDLKNAQCNYVEEFSTGNVDSNTQFRYAYCLVHSPAKSDILKGLDLLRGLCHSGTDQRDYLYYLAVGNYKLNEYKTALKYTSRILQIEPNNRQALTLDQKIKSQMQKDGLLGLGIVGSAIVVGGAALLVGLLSRKK
ncbi:mitochondrial fission 1 protein-like [Actinia tenebrosa]|uniref:Mitochondrial fission 1 protein n=1 Tax=Actinia tenebrosa TaxID=6105 RepID=A0A6P8I1V6_ACTTE|nr:mitochondrial fission 1 protein-like [Actinia tenebrosa]